MRSPKLCLVTSIGAVLAVGCSSGTPVSTPVSLPPSSAIAGPPAPSTSGSPAHPSPIPLPTPSGTGFCGDRLAIETAVRLARQGRETWRQVDRYIEATRAIVVAGASLEPDAGLAIEIRQLAIDIHTLGLAVRGAVENYPIDDAVSTWTLGVQTKAAAVAKHIGC